VFAKRFVHPLYQTRQLGLQRLLHRLVLRAGGRGAIRDLGKSRGARPPSVFAN
jgi:hypothetical protein